MTALRHVSSSRLAIYCFLSHRYALNCMPIKNEVRYQVSLGMNHTLPCVPVLHGAAPGNLAVSRARWVTHCHACQCCMGLHQGI